MMSFSAGVTSFGWGVKHRLQRSSVLGLVLLGMGIIPLLLFFFSIQKAVFLIALSVGVGTVLVLPIQKTLFVFYFYLVFDGFIKLFSGYHPLAHVGQDIVLLIIFWRAMLDRETGGPKKLMQIPLGGFVLIFSTWVLLQYLNPFGLGLLPSIAGSKIYFASIAIYIVSYSYLDESARHKIMLWIVTLAAFECVLATMEYLFFPEYLYNLSSDGAISFSNVSKDRFIGAFYRPIGTTSLPGAPSVWVSLAAPFATYILSSPEWSRFNKIIATVFFVFAIPTLIFCQMRINVILTLLGVIAVALFPRSGFTSRLGVASAASVAAITLVFFIVNKMADNIGISLSDSPMSLTSSSGDNSSGDESAGKLMQLQGRMLTLGEKSTFTTARGGAIDAMVRLGEQMPFGIGLSRVSAASSPWLDIIKKDPHFGVQWTFSDNLFRAIFTELGIFGLMSWILMVGAIVLTLFKSALLISKFDSAFLVWTCATGALTLFSGGLDSEGVLYAPVSSLIWLMFGIGMREVKNVQQI